MDLKKMQQKRLEALEKSYANVMKAMEKPLDVHEVDPEKMKISISAYDTAREVSANILEEIQFLQDTLKDKTDEKTKKEFFGVETMLKR